MFVVVLLVVVAVLWYTACKIHGLASGSWFSLSGETTRFNKAVVVTGCDSGFGFALTKSLLQSGVVVFATYFTPEGQGKLDELPHRNDQLITCHVDISNDEQVDYFKNKVAADLKGREFSLWGLVNNAGTALIACPTDWMTLSDIHHHMDVNCYGAIRTTNVFLPFIKKSCGRVVFVTSVQGMIVFPENAAYSMSKFALEAYAGSLRMNMQYFDVNVSIVAPGGFVTNANRDLSHVAHFTAGRWETLDQTMKEEYPYATVQSRSAALCDNTTENRATDLSPVVNALNHALFGKRPLIRYVIGWDAWINYMPLLLLPGHWHDWVLTKWFMAKLKSPVKYTTAGSSGN